MGCDNVNAACVLSSPIYSVTRNVKQVTSTEGGSQNIPRQQEPHKLMQLVAFVIRRIDVYLIALLHYSCKGGVLLEIIKALIIATLNPMTV